MSDNNSKERTKIDLIFGSVSYEAAKEKGQEYFLNTIKLMAGDLIKYDETVDNKIKNYRIDGYDYYALINNYEDIKAFLSNNAINQYNEFYEVKEFENKYYTKKYRYNTNKEYVGSIIELNNYNDQEIFYNIKSYYCSDGEFKGILDKEPDCHITQTKDQTFTMVYENKMLKIKDLSEFNDTKKIY